MKEVLVTGGAGFVGSHLCDALVARGERVVCLDNLSTGQAANIEHLRGHPRFSFVRGDVTREADWAALQPAGRIYHLASPASPDDYQRTPVETIRTNVVGTLHALGFARAHGARLLLASTSEVYGDPAVHPQPEGYWGHVNPVGPRSCYDEGKRCAEALLVAHAAQHGTQVRLARLFNTYGPRLRADDGRVVSCFIAHALRGEPLPVKGKVEADGKGCEGVRVDFKLRTPTGRMISIQSLSTVAGGAYDGAIVVPPGVDVGDYELVVSTDGNPQCGSGSSE